MPSSCSPPSASLPLVFAVPWRPLSGLLWGFVHTGCRADLKLMDAVAARILDELSLIHI